MSKCAYVFEFDGVEHSFNSSKELEVFVKNNKEKFKHLGEKTDVVKFIKNFSTKRDVRSEAEARLAAINEESRDIEYMGNDMNGLKKLEMKGKRGFKGANKFIQQNQSISPVFIKENWFNNYTEVNWPRIKREQNVSTEVAKTIAREEVEKLSKDFEKLAGMGTKAHSLIESYFKNPDKRTIEHFKELTGDTFSDNALSSLMDYFVKVEDYLMAQHGVDAMILPEFKVYDQKSKVMGIIDLLVVDKNGDLHIYDLKASYKNYDQWHSSKNISISAVQGVYRQLLRTKGFDGSEEFGDVKTIKILPITFNDIDFDNETVGGISEEGVAVDYTTTQTAKINKFIETGIPHSKKLSFKISNDSASKIEEEIKTLSGYELKATKNQKDKEAQIDEAVKKGHFYDVLEEVRVRVTPDTADALITDYMERLENENYNEVSRVSIAFSKAKNKYLETGVNELGLYRTGKNQEMANLFSRYLEPEWDMIDNRVVSALGIIVFKNNKTNVYEFVSITTNKLNKIHRLEKGTKILGKYKKDHELQTRDYLYDSSGKSFEFVKIGLLINDHPEIFEDGSIGLIRVYNPSSIGRDQKVDGTDFQTLKKNIRDLLTVNGNEKNYSMDSVAGEDYMINLLSRLEDAANSQIMQETAIGKSFLTKFEENQNNRAKVLNELFAELKTRHQINENSVSNSENTLLVKIFEQASYAMLHEKGRELTIEKNMKSYSLGDDAVNTSNPDSIKNKNVKVVIDLFSRAAYNIGVKVEASIKKNEKPFQAFWSSQGAGAAVRNTVGITSNIYKNLFVKDDKGNITDDFELRNPETDKTLTPEEKKFIEFYLEKLNSIRYPNASEEEVRMLKGNGMWYAVPLTPKSSGSLNPKVIIEKFKNIRNEHAFADEEEGYNELSTESSLMLKMINSLDSQKDKSKRDSFISKKGVESFEINLEELLNTYTLFDIRKKEFDEVLPTISAIKFAIKMQEFNMMSPQNYTIEYIDKWTKMAVYNDKMVAKEFEGIMKFMGNAKSLASKGMLAFNAFGAVRDIMQGTWNNISLLMHQNAPKDSFGKAELLKAYSILMSNTDMLTSISLTESINNSYRMANMDLNALNKKQLLSETGLTAGTSRWMLWATTAPDYMTRMGMFVAQMIKDGCYDAHSFDMDGNLSYDFKKDKRFDAYSKGDTKHLDYGKQRGLYLAMLEEFRNTDPHLELKEGDALPRAYTHKQRDSMKSLADMIHGSFDHETKMLYTNTVLGSLFNQFRTYLSAKKNQYAMEGGVRQQGVFVHKTDVNGSPYYRDANGNLTTDVTDCPVYEWEGRYMEGIYQSFKRTFKDLQAYKFDMVSTYKDIMQDDVRKANFKRLGSDLMIFALIATLASMWDWREMKEDKVFLAALAKAFSASAEDLNPIKTIESFGFSDKTPFITFSYYSRLMSVTAGYFDSDVNFVSNTMKASGAASFFASSVDF